MTDQNNERTTADPSSGVYGHGWQPNGDSSPGPDAPRVYGQVPPQSGQAVPGPPQQPAYGQGWPPAAPAQPQAPEPSRAYGEPWQEGNQAQQAPPQQPGYGQTWQQATPTQAFPPRPGYGQPPRQDAPPQNPEPISVFGDAWQTQDDVPRQPEKPGVGRHMPRGGVIAAALGLSIVLGLCAGLGSALLTGNTQHPTKTPELANLNVHQQPSPSVATSTPAPAATTPVPATVPASGPFTATLLGYASQLCVDPVPGGAGAVQLAACGVGPEQSFAFQPVAGGAYTLADAQTDQCLGVAGAQTTDGDPVVPANCDNQPDQEWLLRPASGGDGQDYQLVSALSGKCLDASNEGTQAGTPLQEWDCHGDPFNPANQAWRVEVSQ